MKKINDNNKLAVQMLAAMILGILAGLAFMAVREMNGAASSVWMSINNILFQDITAKGADSRHLKGLSTADPVLYTRDRHPEGPLSC